MMKRILSFVLAAVLLVGLVPATVLTASAATMKTSNSGIAMIKGFEGFSAKPYQHGAQWYVGYGTRIESDKKDLYSTGITTKAAEELMKQHLKDVVEPALNTFITTNNRPLSQTQFDALASLSYNIGTGWLTSSSSVIRSYVLQQKGGDQFVQTLVERNSLDPSSDYFPGLVSRRLKEANLYLNGTYNSAGNYTYVVLKDDDGATLDATDSVLVINTKSLPAMPEAPSSPETFLGWYTRSYTSSGALAKEEPVYSLSGMGGKTLWPKWNGDSSYTINANNLISTKVYDVADPATITDTTKAVCNLMANSSFKVEEEKVVQNIKWAYGTGKDTKGAYCQGWVAVHDNDGITGNSSVKVIASATITTATGGWPNPVYAGTPITNFPEGTVLKVVEKRVDATNSKKTWGRVVYGEGGYDYLWVDLDCAKVINDSYNDTNPYLGKTAVVTNCAQLNVRNAAGMAGTTVIARIGSGTKVTIYDTSDVEGKLWARVKWGEANEGWVYTYYLNVTGVSNGASTGGSTTSDVLLYTGIVISNTNLNVRKQPAVNGTWVTSLATGTKVNIYEVTTTAGHRWGRTEKGWICLDYVNLTQVQQPTTPSGSNGTTGAGTGVTMYDVNAYQEADNNSKVMFTLKKGESIAISEQVPQKTASGSKIWGKVTVNGVTGWVNMAYVEVQTVTVVPPADESGSNSGIDPVNGSAGVIANASIPVNVRIAAGVQNNKVASLAVGTAVTVYELTEVNGAQWARIKWNGNEGWVAKQYVNLTGGIGGTGSSNTANGTTPGQISLTGTVNSNINLNVRSGAGLGNPQIASLPKGTKVTVYEQVTADGMLWGKINVNGTSGWVCMSYISVEQTSSSGTGVMGTIARCFDSVNVRSAPGVGNAIVGKLKVGTRVEIYEQRLYSAQYWGRVAQGWICMEYVVTDGIVPEGPISGESTQETTISSDAVVNNNKELVYNIKATTKTNRQYVYKDATDKSGVAGTIDANMPITILAFKADGDKTWGKINDYNTPGWIDLAGVTFPSKIGYINSDNQPVYAKPDSSSTTIQVLSCGTQVTYIKYAMFGDVPFVGLTTGTTDVTGWVPMSKISDTALNVALTYNSALGITTGNGSGKTMVLTDVLESPNSANVVFKLAAMSDVTFFLQMDDTFATRADGGKVWVKVATDDTTKTGWLDVSKLSFTASYVLDVPFNVRVDSSMDSTIVRRMSAGTITISSVVCDASGNVWGKIASPDATLNNYWIRLDGKDQPTAVTSTDVVSGTTAYGVTSGIVNAYTNASGSDVLFQLAAGTRVSFNGTEYSTAPGARVKIHALGNDAYVNVSDLASFALSAFVTTADSAVYDGTGTDKIQVATLQIGSPVTITGIIVDSGNTYFNIGIGYIQNTCIGVINP